MLLALLARKPSHGYELIKEIELASSGLYIPSPGVVYPTLSLLVDQDFAVAVSDEGESRKKYQITPAGQEELAKHQPFIDALFARLRLVSERNKDSLLPGIVETMQRLKGLLRGNMMRADLSQRQVESIHAALQQAVESIESQLRGDSADQ